MDEHPPPAIPPEPIFIGCPSPDCDAPAVVTEQLWFRSTDGPIEHVKVRCVAGHWFMGATEILVLEEDNPNADVWPIPDLNPFPYSAYRTETRLHPPDDEGD
jgi:hypothetical protein